MEGYNRLNEGVEQRKAAATKAWRHLNLVIAGYSESNEKTAYVYIHH